MSMKSHFGEINFYDFIGHLFKYKDDPWEEGFVHRLVGIVDELGGDRALKLHNIVNGSTTLARSWYIEPECDHCDSKEER